MRCLTMDTSEVHLDRNAPAVVHQARQRAAVHAQVAQRTGRAARAHPLSDRQRAHQIGRAQPPCKKSILLDICFSQR